MPFVSDNQRKFCWTKYNRDVREGKTPKWNCSEWEHSTRRIKRSNKQRSKSINKKYRSPRLSDMSKNSRRYMRSKVNKKIYTGVRGGKYVLINGRKIYV